MSKLDPRIEAVRQQYGLEASDFWQIPQNKQWVCKHAALEIVATKANVEWSAPQIIEANTGSGIAVLAVTGKMGERVEWATGEASPKNNKNSYPWAMAEKRAKDRVILKLVGIHGLVYSEDEMPETPAQPANSERVSYAQMKRGLEEIEQELLDCNSVPAVLKCAEGWKHIMERDGWTTDYRDLAREKVRARLEHIKANEDEKEAA